MKTRIFTGNDAVGYTHEEENTAYTVYNEANARRSGVIKGAVLDDAACCGFGCNGNYDD